MLFDEHVEIYFNASDDKKTHLKLKEMPEDGKLFDNRTNKKQPVAQNGSDCLHVAERAGFEPAVRVNVRTLSKRVPSTTQPPLHRRAEKQQYSKCKTYYSKNICFCLLILR